MGSLPFKANIFKVALFFENKLNNDKAHLFIHPKSHRCLYALSNLQASFPPSFFFLRSFLCFKLLLPPPMEKHRYGLVLTVFVVAALGVISFVSCIAAEIKRTREDEVELVGKLCKLPESYAFAFGIAALICLVVAQVVGNLVAICSHFCSREKKSSASKAKQPMILIALMFISWMSFVMAVTLISTATSMSRKQSYGEGWLDGECYLVKQGIYIGSGILVLVTVGSTLGLVITTLRKSNVEEGSKVGEQSKLNTKL